jgi:mRNA interferase HigB
MGTRIIARATLRGYAADYPDAAQDLEAWHTLISKSDFANFAELRNIVATASLVNSEWLVFNIRGNRYRLITRVHFGTKVIFVKDFLTHQAYDAWSAARRKEQ